MLEMLMKFLYIILRDFSIFNLPLLRNIRNIFYSKRFNAEYINVDFRVRIQPLHASPDASIIIGSELHIGADTLVDYTGGIVIGERVTISEGAKIYTHTHDLNGAFQNWREMEATYSKLVISDDAWIASGAIVLESVKYIGSGAVIAAGSIVTKDVPDATVVAGNPARFVKLRPFTLS